uniref:N-acetyltransferase domain-containing protein n=1 Tax=Trichogramma kaykai TaxID=54128 RepID=A0ABD2XSC0_9HYME
MFQEWEEPSIKPTDAFKNFSSDRFVNDKKRSLYNCSTSSNEEIYYDSFDEFSDSSEDLPIGECVPETPEKSRNKVLVRYAIPLPRIQKKKGKLLNTSITENTPSPEIKQGSEKILNNLIPNDINKSESLIKPLSKVKISLFQDRDSNSNVSTSLNKSVNDIKEKYQPPKIKTPPNTQKSSYYNPSYYKSSAKNKKAMNKKKRRDGGINFGVGHGIKKPKPKPKPVINKAKMEQIKGKDSKIINSNIIKENATLVNKVINIKKSNNPETLQKANSNLSIDTFNMSNEEKSKSYSFEEDEAVKNIDVINIISKLEHEDDEENLKNKISYPNNDLSTMYNDNSYNEKTSIITKEVTDNNQECPTEQTSVDSIKLSSSSTSSKDSSNNTETQEKYFPLFSKNFNPTSKNNQMTEKHKTTNVLKSMKDGDSENQYQIDAGQNKFGAIKCSECKMIYQIGDKKDETAHYNYHNTYKVLKFQGWKKERIVYNNELADVRIILVESHDPSSHWKKVFEIFHIANDDLGFSDFTSENVETKKAYLYIEKKTIVGLLIGEQIKSAYTVLPDLVPGTTCCSNESTDAKCGIFLVWIIESHRRKGIASKMIDVLRSSYYYGIILSTEDIAFSTPTISGKEFAKKYTKTSSFKVY